MQPKNGKEILEETFRSFMKAVKSEINSKSPNFKEFIVPLEGLPKK